jgi:mitochondrial-processing peptidase subunit beta
MYSKLLLSHPKKAALKFCKRMMSSQVQKAEAFSIQEKEKHKQFSKSPIMDNFGELPLGEIPNPLKYARPFNVTTLSNGIRVATEYWPSKTSAIGVFIGAGSRDETIETSGAAHFLEHLHFKGTSNRSRIQIEQNVENLGAQLNAYTSREHTLYHMQVFNKDQATAMDVLSDMLTNSHYNSHQIEVERETILQELEETNKDFLETLMENVYFNIYREHMMGHPILGDIDNINIIDRDMIVEFHHNHYYGDNMVIVATGNVNHNEIVDMAEEKFGKVKKDCPGKRLNTERPIYNPALLMIRDDEMINSNVGVFYDAPHWTHKDYYGFLLLQRIFGSYSIDQNAEHLNDVHKQYNALHTMIGDLPDVTKHECIYSPYSDCAIFGHYFFGNEIFTRHMNYCGMALNSIYGHYMNEVEVFRARNKLYHELMHIQTVSDVLQSIGPQLLYLGRRVHRSEIAQRVSYFDAHHMKNL